MSGPLHALGVRFMQSLKIASLILSGDLTVGGNIQSISGTKSIVLTPSAASVATTDSGSSTSSTLTPTALVITAAGFGAGAKLEQSTLKLGDETQVITTRRTGYTNAMTGTANRATSYDTGTITLVQLAQRVKALQDDLTTHGLIGP